MGYKDILKDEGKKTKQTKERKRLLLIFSSFFSKLSFHCCQNQSLKVKSQNLQEDFTSPGEIVD